MDAFNETTPNFVPTEGIAAVSGTGELDAWFTDANFVGGVDPNNDWTQGWTTSAPN